MAPETTPRISFSRRDTLKAGVALAAVPLVGALRSDASALVFPTGSADVDRALGGGIRSGCLLVVIGPPRSGKTDFLLRLAKTNGIVDAHNVNQGTSDMLSIMRRHDGQHIGSVVLNGHEPSTDKECADMAQDPAARDAFLSRWFRRTKEVLSESGGIFALTVTGETSAGKSAGWMSFPDYIIQAEGTTYTVIKAG